MSRPSRIARRAAAATLAASLLLMSAHVGSGISSGVARDNAQPPEKRIRAARATVMLKPFDPRPRTTLVIAEARALLDADRVGEAFWLLLPLSTVVRDDPLFTATYREAVARKTPLDARKAHQQHAREDAEGNLDPEDVEK